MELFQVWHEINNSLTAVNLTLEFLQQSSDIISSTELAEELAFSLHSLEHVKNVIQTASAAVDQATNDSSFDVIEVIQQVAAIISHKWPNSMLTLTKNTMNLELYGDKTALTQVFMNLCSNALESYGNKDYSGELKVQIHLKKVKNGNLEVVVKDRGEGIPIEAQTRIFDEFFTLKKDRGGTGIGLALCKQIVEEKFGGKLSFKSRVGKGSEFKVLVPTK